MITIIIVNNKEYQESLKACVRHPKLAGLYCIKYQHLQNVRKNIPEIDSPINQNR